MWDVLMLAMLMWLAWLLTVGLKRAAGRANSTEKSTPRRLGRGPDATTSRPSATPAELPDTVEQSWTALDDIQLNRLLGQASA